MTDLRKAAENLIKIVDDTPYGDFEMALSELRQALAQPEQILTAKVVVTGVEQEPVAWLYTDAKGREVLVGTNTKPYENAQPFYTAPPKREWQGLTSDDKHFLLANAWNKEQAFDGFMDAIDKFLKEKNT